MTIDLEQAFAFMTSNARVLDRLRFGLHAGDGDPAKTLVALAAYRNGDGGYGWGLEPDLRARGSQPVGALHAFEVFDEAARATSAATNQATNPTTNQTASPDTAALCDWLESVTEPDGGLPFVLPIDNPVGSSPVWVGAAEAAEGSTIHMTALVAAIAHSLARHDQNVAKHPWLARATDYSSRAIATLEEPGHAYELRSALLFLDAVAESQPGARDELRRMAKFLPADATMPVAGGIEGEALRPLDFSPNPDGPLREYIATDVIEADLDRLAAEQRDDGGWTVDFATASPAAALEWRGYATVSAVGILRAHGRA